MSSSVEHVAVHQVIEAFIHSEPFGSGKEGHKLGSIVKEHAIAATAIGLDPEPFSSFALLIGNTWTMYVRMNHVFEVSFNEHALRSIASGILANLATAIPAMTLGMVAEFALKFIPGPGTAIGMAAGAAINYAVTYVAAVVYITSMKLLLETGKPLTIENITEAIEQVTQHEEFIKAAYKQGKKEAAEAKSATKH